MSVESKFSLFIELARPLPSSGGDMTLKRIGQTVVQDR